jgi:hypothetical protein
MEAGIEPQIVDVTVHLSRSQMLGHCLWVLNEKVEPLLHRVGGFHEAIRLIGCIQGTRPLRPAERPTIQGGATIGFHI